MPRVTLPPSPNASGLQQALKELLGRAASPEEFAHAWLTQVATASGATSGRLHRPSAAGTLFVVAETGASKTPPTNKTETADESKPEAIDVSGPPENTASDESAASEKADDPIQRALFEVYTQGRPQILAAGVNATDADPTDQPRAFVPLVLEGEVRGVTELVFALDSKPERHRAAVQIVVTAASYLAEFERRRRQRELDRRQSLVDEIERFTRSVHEKLSTRHVAYVAANDGRGIIGCDRVTVLIRRGRRYDVVAVSGVDEIENRSRAAKLLGRLATVTAATGESFDSQADYEKLSPQLLDAVNQYLDETHVRAVSVVPLLPAAPEVDEKQKRRRPTKRPQPLGALVVEQIEDVSPTEGRSERAAFVAQHTTLALAKALEHETIPLLPLWKLCGWIGRLFAPGTRAKTWAVLAIIAAVLAALKFIQADFVIHADGMLQPVERRHVFAPLDATVKAIHVRHGDHVEAGQLLVELRNADLDVSWADVTGQRMTTHEQLLAVERSLYEDTTKIGVEERHRLAGRRSELKQKLVSLDEQLEILRRKRELLRVVSPIAGEVTTWDVEQTLRNRPIRQGQILLDVADGSGSWELEIQVPEDGIAQLLSAQETQGKALKVSYRLATEPRNDRFAEIRDVHYAAEIRGDEGNTVLAKATLIDRAALPGIRSGAEATTKVYCGRRALGYVWLHDAVDFVRTHIWFRMY